MFKDRLDGGRRLAKALEKYRGQDVVVYGLPRGGVVTASAVAEYLEAPLDLVITRKIGHPWNLEYAVGAITEDGDSVFNESELSDIDPTWLAREEHKQLVEAQRRRSVYLAGRKKVRVKGKTAIIVDDGIATGYTMLAALKTLKKLGAGRVVVAVPIVQRGTKAKIEALVDEVVAIEVPTALFAIGQFYEDFTQVCDEDVIALMGVKASK